MTSKSNGANYGAKRVVKAVNFVNTAKPPKKKPLGYEDDEDSDKRSNTRRT